MTPVAIFPEKRTRSQLTLPDIPLPLHRSPLKDARNAMRINHTMATSSDAQADDTEDELLISPHKPTTHMNTMRAVSAIKRPSDPDTPSSDTRHSKRPRHEPIATGAENTRHARHKSDPSAGVPRSRSRRRAGTATPSSMLPSGPSTTPVNAARARSVPLFSTASLDEAPRLDLANPPMSPWRARTKSPERQLRITSQGSNHLRLPAIADDGEERGSDSLERGGGEAQVANGTDIQPADAMDVDANTSAPPNTVLSTAFPLPDRLPPPEAQASPSAFRPAPATPPPPSSSLPSPPSPLTPLPATPFVRRQPSVGSDTEPLTELSDSGPDAVSASLPSTSRLPPLALNPPMRLPGAPSTSRLPRPSIVIPSRASARNAFDIMMTSAKADGKAPEKGKGKGKGKASSSRTLAKPAAMEVSAAKAPPAKAPVDKVTVEAPKMKASSLKAPAAKAPVTKPAGKRTKKGKDVPEPPTSAPSNKIKTSMRPREKPKPSKPLFSVPAEDSHDNEPSEPEPVEDPAEEKESLSPHFVTDAGPSIFVPTPLAPGPRDRSVELEPPRAVPPATGHVDVTALEAAPSGLVSEPSQDAPVEPESSQVAPLEAESMDIGSAGDPPAGAAPAELGPSVNHLQPAGDVLMEPESAQEVPIEADSVDTTLLQVEPLISSIETGPELPPSSVDAASLADTAPVIDAAHGLELHAAGLPVADPAEMTPPIKSAVEAQPPKGGPSKQNSLLVEAAATNQPASRRPAPVPRKKKAATARRTADGLTVGGRVTRSVSSQQAKQFAVPVTTPAPAPALASVPILDAAPTIDPAPTSTEARPSSPLSEPSSPTAPPTPPPPGSPTLLSSPQVIQTASWTKTPTPEMPSKARGRPSASAPSSPSPAKLARSTSLFAPRVSALPRPPVSAGAGPSSLSTLAHALEKLRMPPPARPNTSMGFNRDTDDDTPEHAAAGTSRSGAGLARSATLGVGAFKALPRPAGSSGTGKLVQRQLSFLPPHGAAGARGARGGAVGLSGSKPRIFGVGLGRRLVQKASRKTSLPSVMASPVKGAADDTDDAGDNGEGSGDRDAGDGSAGCPATGSAATIAEDAPVPGDVFTVPPEGDTALMSAKGKGKERATDAWRRNASQRASLASQALSQSLNKKPRTGRGLMGPPATPASAQASSSAQSGASAAQADESSRPYPVTSRSAPGALGRVRRMADPTSAGPVAEATAASQNALQVLQECTIFVDVRTDDGEDAGDLFVDMLKTMGARIPTRVSGKCTHIVYKNGLMSTLKRYRLLREPLPLVVGIAWVVACAEQHARVGEAKFAIDLDGVNVAGTNKRRRSMLPKLMPMESEDGGTATEAVGDEDRSMEGSSSSMILDDDLPPLEKARRRKSMLFGPKQ